MLAAGGRGAGHREGRRAASLGPGRPIPLPGVRQVAVFICPTEQDDDLSLVVVSQRVPTARGRRGHRCALHPGGSIPLPGVRQVLRAGVEAAEEDYDAPPAVVSQRVAVTPRRRDSGRALRPGRPIPLPGIAEVRLAHTAAAEQDGDVAGDVVSQGMIGAPRRRGGRGAFYPGGSIPLPGVAQATAVTVQAAEEHHPLAGLVIGQPLAGSGGWQRRGGMPDPGASVPFPGVVVHDSAKRVQATAEQHGQLALLAVGQRVRLARCRSVSRGGRGGRHKRCGRRCGRLRQGLPPGQAIPFPGVVQQAGSALAAEQDNRTASHVVSEGMSAARGRRGVRRALGPGGPVPFPGIAAIAATVPCAAEQDRYPACAIVGQGMVGAAGRLEGRIGLDPGAAVPFPGIVEEGTITIIASEQDNDTTRTIIGQGMANARRGGGRRADLCPGVALPDPQVIAIPRWRAGGFASIAAEQERHPAGGIVSQGVISAGGRRCRRAGLCPGCPIPYPGIPPQAAAIEIRAAPEQDDVPPVAIVGQGVIFAGRWRQGGVRLRPCAAVPLPGVIAGAAAALAAKQDPSAIGVGQGVAGTCRWGDGRRERGDAVARTTCGLACARLGQPGTEEHQRHQSGEHQPPEGQGAMHRVRAMLHRWLRSRDHPGGQSAFPL